MCALGHLLMCWIPKGPLSAMPTRNAAVVANPFCTIDGAPLGDLSDLPQGKRRKARAACPKVSLGGLWPPMGNSAAQSPVLFCTAVLYCYAIPELRATVHKS